MDNDRACPQCGYIMCGPKCPTVYVYKDVDGSLWIEGVLQAEARSDVGFDGARLTEPRVAHD